MLKRVELLVPFALIVAAPACGGESSSVEEGQGAPQPNSAGGAGGVRPGFGWGGVRPGWVNGSWNPGWGWNAGLWVVGGATQYSCVTDADCAATLGPGVAVCDFESTVGLGQCVAPNWY
jgi:hypothetical protein